MKVAFYGRVSTHDVQDPSLSIPRQLAKCNEVLGLIGEEVNITFWDVESGRKALEKRGAGGQDWTTEVKVPRLGGLPELLATAGSGVIDAVIVESIDRLSRLTADGTQIERQLEEHDVVLFAADEPLSSNATAILTRRVKQGVAEWYGRDLLERSRAGMEESVRQGWHAGGPAPYGYLLKPHPHPNPQKARDGLKKHRLVPDPVRAPIVAMIFSDYVEKRLGLGAICDKLNSRPSRYPPPSRRGDLPDRTWSRSQLRSLLRNPKYTGYNVWNRHDKRKGHPRQRPPDQWIWSADPTHEAIVARALFDAVEERSRLNVASPTLAMPRHYRARRRGNGKRLYVLRGRVRCGLCGRRMEGSHQKGSNWYRCQYVSRRGLAIEEAGDHPKVLGIKEDVLLGAIREFMAERIFGPERIRLLRDTLDIAKDDRRTAERIRLEGERERIETAMRRQTLHSEEYEDPQHPLVELVKARIEELSAQRDSVTQTLTDLADREREEPSATQLEATLARIPDLRATMASAEGEQLIELFEAFDVTVSYDKVRRELELGASITCDPPEGRSQGFEGVAGAGFEPATFGL